MEIVEGSKYKNKHTEKSIVDIKVDENYTIYVFKGTLSKNDIVIKYSKLGKRTRTPKHIHWVIDVLLKEQKNHNDVVTFIKCMQETWDDIKGLENNDFETIKNTLQKYKSEVDRKTKGLKFDGGEYPIDFVLVLLLLLMIQEKTNRPDAYMFKKILDELLKENMDIFSIVSTSTLGRR